jgi:hypothetical protein
MEQEVNVKLKIITDGKYCGDRCRWYEYHIPGRCNPRWCRLYSASIEECLGGGPLRRAECVAATNGIQEEPK